MTNTVKELGFRTNILVKSYQYYAFPIGILLSGFDMEEPELLVYFFTDIFMSDRLQYYDSHYRKWDCLIVNDIKLYKNNFIDGLIDLINNEEYAYLPFVDEYYIPNRSSFSKKKLIHDLLISGYNIVNQAFSIIGFDNEHRFRKSEVSFNQLISSCFSDDEYVSVVSIRSKRGFNFEIEYGRLISEFQSYILSKKLDMSNYSNDNNYYFGFNSYKMFYKKFKEESIAGDIFEKMKYHFLRDIYFSYEHKNMIYYKLIYMCNNNILSRNIDKIYKEIVYNISIIKNIYIKFIITNNYIYIDKVQTKFKNILKTEERILDKILTQIENSN